MPKYSIIIPVYNRPDEMAELLESLSKQTFKDFELIIVEDGSRQRCDHLIEKYAGKYDITYEYKPNTGRSDSRNIGMTLSKADYFIFFDSDCIIPPDYLSVVDQRLQTNYTDCYGGPDAAHESFSPLQKAISHSMTSFFTTGGIRGGKKQMEKFCPRSFNMGFSRKVYETVGGFLETFGEDIDLSTRIKKAGFETQLIREAFVYHKRRVNLNQFYKQVNIFGQARIYLHRTHPGSMKLVHTAPAVFNIGMTCIVFMSLFCPWLLLLPAAYSLLLFIDASIKNKSLYIGMLAVVTGYIQLFGYGTGFIKAFWKKIILREPLESSSKINSFYHKASK